MTIVYSRYLLLTLKVVFDDAMETIEATEEAIEETSVEPGETVEEALEDFLADS